MKKMPGKNIFFTPNVIYFNYFPPFLTKCGQK